MQFSKSENNDQGCEHNLYHKTNWKHMTGLNDLQQLYFCINYENKPNNPVCTY